MEDGSLSRYNFINDIKPHFTSTPEIDCDFISLISLHWENGNLTTK